MYIERIILSGFKTYREHTVIDGFDRFINAITGPNGSGKSNILDAICFVLGISNLSLIRASSLQDLIYKNGQSGVKKASVEIIFNNEDKAMCPIGYEQFDHISVSRQITSGSVSKYFINDHAANQQRVQTLFHSVQLNVNNPHFLIMQGQVAKILNMKPPEILGLIEEAAGIRMFEDKKEDSLKVLEKKQKQLDEINKIIDDELKPNLEKLRREREEYNRWSSLRSEGERLQRWIVAFDYKECDNEIKNGVQIIKKAEEKKTKIINEEKEANQKLESLKLQIKELSTIKEGDEKGRFTELDNKINQYQIQITKAQTLKDQSIKEIERFQTKQNKIQQQLENSNELLKNKKEEAEKVKEKLDSVSEEVNKIEKTVQYVENRISSINIGIASENDEFSLSEQIENQKRIISDCEIKIHGAEESIHYNSRKQQELENKIQNAVNEINELEAKRNNSLIKLTDLENELNNISFDPEHEKNLNDEHESLLNSLSQTRERIDVLERQLVGIDFEYTPPQGFDQRTVYGVLVRLIKVKDQSYCVALEKVAGGKLFYVVVEDASTATRIIEEGRLPRRYNLIPLKQIVSNKINDDTIKLAKKKSNSANLAMDLIEYSPDITPAIQFAFGQTFVCDDPESAKNIAFDHEIKVKTVTKDGDIYDPQGTLTGGSRPENRKPILELISEYNSLLKNESNIVSRLRGIDAELKDMNYSSEKYHELIQKYELVKHELDLIQDAINHSTHEEAKKQLQDLKKLLLDCQNTIEECTNKRELSKEKLDELNIDLMNWNNNKNKAVAELEKQLQSEKNKYEEIKQKRNEQQGIYDILIAEIEETEKELSSITNEQAKLSKNIENKETIRDKSIKELEELLKEKEVLEEALKQLKEKISETNELLSKYIQEEDSMQKIINSASIKKKKIEQKIERLTENRKGLKSKLQRLKQENKWIETEERFFGVPHTDFDFKAHDPKEAKERYTNITEEQKQLENHVNKKVISICERAENELNSLLKKKNIVEDEKKKIISVIEELEIKKREAIETTHKNVTRDLHEIVEKILPGISVALIAPPGQTIFDGLDIEVSASGVKKSLVELSGGQRSSIALALILALLKFKPAPIYILDEVDAHLDISITQNIGRLLKNAFQKAQFIIVSHQEGMWNNASVLFRTSFHDSNTYVQRIVNNND